MHFEIVTLRVLHERSINPLPKNVYINCTICIQKLYKTLNLYIFCIQRSCKSKCTKNVHQIPTYIKNVQPVQNLYKVQTKNGLNLEMYVFCTYKQCTNCTKPIQVAN